MRIYRQAGKPVLLLSYCYQLNKSFYFCLGKQDKEPLWQRTRPSLPLPFSQSRKQPHQLLLSVRRALMGCVSSPHSQKWDRQRSSQGVGGCRGRRLTIESIKRCKTISGVDRGAPREGDNRCQYATSKQTLKEGKTDFQITQNQPVLSFCQLVTLITTLTPVCKTAVPSSGHKNRCHLAARWTLKRD